MKSEVIKMPTVDVSFPCIAKDKTSGAIVLFKTKNEFTCLVADDNFCYDDEDDEPTRIGDHYSEKNPIFDPGLWEVIPKIAIKFKM
jgi:hypothetical protein